MNENEFRQKISANKIPTLLYCINNSIKDDCHCIVKNYHRWEVFYRERGIESDKKIFLNEGRAWDYFYEQIIHSFEFMKKLDQR